MKLLFKLVANNTGYQICIEPISSSVLGIYISEEKNMTIAEKLIRSLVEKYGKHTVYTDGGTVSRHMSNKWIEALSTFTNRKEF